MIVLVLVIILAVGVIIWSFQGAEADRFHRRMPIMVGSVLVFGGFFFLGWIRFAPLDFAFDILPDVIEESAVGFVSWLLNMAGDLQLSRWISWITQIGALPGWLLILVIPTRQFVLRLVLISIGLFSVLNVVWTPLAAAMESSRWGRRIDLFFGVVSLLQCLVIFLLLPTIDSWGTATTYLPAFLALVLGVQMGNGVWVTLIGLLLLSVGYLAGAFTSTGYDYVSQNGELTSSGSQPLDPYTIP